MYDLYAFLIVTFNGDLLRDDLNNLLALCFTKWSINYLLLVCSTVEA